MSKVFEIITERVVEALKQGVVPWRKPWRTAGEIPMNLVSGKAYRGINVFLLAMQGYGSPYWLTRKQVIARGGTVKDDQKKKAAMITFWKNWDTGDVDENGKPVKRFVLRYYYVYNVEQTEGVEYPKPELKDHDPIAACEAVVAGWSDCPPIKHGGDRASYCTATDEINMPVLGRFDSPAAYHAALFHEMGHATGSDKRLNRDLTGARGSRSYALDELVAEMTAAFLCGHCGIECEILDNATAYIGMYLTRLSNDVKLVVTAGSKAQKAVDMILGNADANVKPANKTAVKQANGESETAAARVAAA